ncbi:MAG: hypothetical protein JWN02_1508, partial [Acidobacteria bacterium]|nr:hypothetical protein [Acidobacteriota bacterium]
EVEGRRALLDSNPEQAIAAFSRALSAAGEDDYRTYRARLFAQRSEAYRRSGNRRAAEADLSLALKEVGIEEKAILRQRDPKANTDILISYFSRFQDTYRLLIQQLVEEHRTDEAFLYVEKARAAEPLNLIGHLAPLSKCLRQLSLNDGALDLRRLQASLPTGTVLFEYCLIEKGTYVWIVTREHVEFRELRAKVIEIKRWADTLQDAGTKQRIDLFEAGLYAPFLELIDEPLKAAKQIRAGRPIERLVIIPDGAMHGLPFAALRNNDSMRYLAEEAPIAIQGSGALYLVSLCRDAELPRRAPSVLLVGNPTLKQGLSIAEGLRDLPKAQEEVTEIAAGYTRDHVAATTLIGEQATVPAFLTAAPGSTIVHVAAHAIANPVSPAHSALLLAPSAKDPGVLYAEELLKGLKLPNTRLVVLSACSTGGGAPIGPEGVAPLVRPLIGTGVPAVIGSLWSVDDATAKELLVSFHRHYRQGKDAASAMQSAQLELLHSNKPNFKSPLAWASFEVIGHASSPFARSP